MRDETTRRRLLRAAGVGLAASVAGCASVANRVADRGGTDPTDAPTATADAAADASRATPTPTDSTPRPTDGGGGTTPRTTDDGWSPASVDIEPPSASTSLADAPIPTPPDTRFPRLGSGDATVTATLYGSWKCPYTQAFVRQQLPGYVERYVRPGDLTVEFRSVAYMGGEPFLGPDAPRASRAGLAVWDVDPASYWTYFSYVFANQPQERREWATLGLLTRLAEAAGVRGADTVERTIRAGTHTGLVETAASDAANLGVTTVPRLVVDGTVYAPTVNPGDVRRAVERRIRAAP